MPQLQQFGLKPLKRLISGIKTPGSLSTHIGQFLPYLKAADGLLLCPSRVAFN